MKSTIHVLIYGGGAVGSVFGWRIAQQHPNLKTQVSVVCRSNFDRVRHSGYTLQTSVWGSGRFIPSQVFKAGRLPSNPRQQRFDYVICANKLIDDASTANELQDLRHVVDNDTTLVTAQNGMDVEVPLQRAFPRNTFLSAICQIGCNQIQPGHVVQLARMRQQAFLIGLHSRGRPSDLDILRRDLLVGMDKYFLSVDCVAKARWRKLIFNCAWNSMSALTGLDTHQILGKREASQIVLQLAQEAYQVAIASGVEVESSMPSQTIEMAKQSDPITPSSLQDARSHRPMELGPIFGYLVVQAAKVGVAVPCITVIYDLLRRMNDAYAQQQAWRSSDLLLPPAVDQALGLGMERIEGTGLAAATA